MTKVNILHLVLLCALLPFSGCGLQVFYTVDAPIVINHIPYYSTSDYTEKYFNFTTNEVGMASFINGSSDFSYLGTAIYYKIYTNYSTMTSRNTSIQSTNTSSNYNTAANMLISSYGYLPLGLNSGTDTPLIPGVGTNRSVNIRLMNYQTDPKYSSYITIDGVNIGIPRRDGDSLSFDFGRTSRNPNVNAVPVNGDSDTVYSTFSTGYDNTFFVDLYAVAMGRDATYTIYYSNVLHLGAVAISSSTENN